MEQKLCYTENSLEFMRNGGIRRLQRHGLKADGVYGKIGMALLIDFSLRILGWMPMDA